jgi:hypothetical protein
MHAENKQKYELLFKVGIIIILVFSSGLLFFSLVGFIGSFFGDNTHQTVFIGIGNWLSTSWEFVFFIILSIIGIIGVFKKRSDFLEVVTYYFKIVCLFIYTGNNSSYRNNFTTWYYINFKIVFTSAVISKGVGVYIGKIY